MTTGSPPLSGKLYVVATPIGNLEDITFRAVRVLKEVSLVAAEDTRHTRKLLTAYGIETPQVSYFKHRERQKLAPILERLARGQDVALVSDAGTPGICDPGAILVGEARARGIVVEPVPGPSAVAAAVSVSGFAADRLLFLGFLPSQAKRRCDLLRSVVPERDAVILVFYEAPHRIQSCLRDCLEVVGNVAAVVCRELTKLHEETLAGPLAEVAAELAARERSRGEFVVVLSVGARRRETSPEDLRSMLERYHRQGCSLRDAVAAVALDCQLPRSGVYRMALPIWK
ncbi:MAG: 16S rRNA (cytidine(1402)-2'-O)-methyltransferase [Thermodesulfobacteriota bacterium]